MRKAEVKKLYEKLVEYIGKKLIYLNQVEEWTDVEIASKIGVAGPRLSEIKGYKKGGRLMSENTLAALIGGDIVTIEEFKKHVDLNEDEAAYLDSLALVKNKPLREKVQEAISAGIDVMALIDEALKERGK